MSRQIQDLWPEDIASSTKEISPVTILRQQASLLGKKTKNLVEAEVETKTTDFQRFLLHTFYLIAPALDFYRYPLFQVEHNATEWYPLDIQLSSDNQKELSKKPLAPWDEKVLKKVALPTTSKTLPLPTPKTLSRRKITVRNEEEFLTELQKILTSEQTKEAIQKLMAQSKSF